MDVSQCGDEKERLLETTTRMIRRKARNHALSHKFMLFFPGYKECVCLEIGVTYLQHCHQTQMSKVTHKRKRKTKQAEAVASSASTLKGLSRNPLGLPVATTSRLIDKTDRLADLHLHAKTSSTTQVVSASSTQHKHSKKKLKSQEPWIDASLLSDASTIHHHYRFRLKLRYNHKPVTIKGWKAQVHKMCPEISHIAQSKSADAGGLWAVEVDVAHPTMGIKQIMIHEIIARLVCGLDEAVAIISIAADQTLGVHSLFF